MNYYGRLGENHTLLKPRPSPVIILVEVSSSSPCFQVFYKVRYRLIVYFIDEANSSILAVRYSLVAYNFNHRAQDFDFPYEDIFQLVEIIFDWLIVILSTRSRVRSPYEVIFQVKIISSA